MSPVSSPAKKHIARKRDHFRRRILPAVFGGLSAGFAGIHMAEQLLGRRPYHDSKLSGQAWVDELLQGNEHRFKDQLGMAKHVFLRLLRVLSEKTGVHHTKHVTLQEQLAITLYIFVTNVSNRKAGERFQRSGDTISKVFNRIVKALTLQSFYGSYVKLPDPGIVPLEIEGNSKLYPFLKDALGALDGTHISVSPPAEERAKYRNRKGGLSINVLAGCTFDERFCYVLSGWEGSAADGTVFDDAHKHDLKVPPGKYYLADAGFGTCDALLVPYRGVRYHLREWTAAKNKPATAKELYNLRHSQARNVIERIFGIAKKRFKMLRYGSDYPIEMQARAVPAMCAIHNFIKIHDPDDDLEPWEDGNADSDVIQYNGEANNNQAYNGPSTRTEVSRANKRRDNIAAAMWRSYSDRRGK